MTTLDKRINPAPSISKSHSIVKLLIYFFWAFPSGFRLTIIKRVNPHNIPQCQPSQGQRLSAQEISWQWTRRPDRSPLKRWAKVYLLFLSRTVASLKTIFSRFAKWVISFCYFFLSKVLDQWELLIRRRLPAWLNNYNQSIYLVTRPTLNRRQTNYTLEIE